VFGDDEDWLAYLRDVVARPDAHPEVAPVPAGLSTLEAAARETGHEGRLADAALSLLETGSDAERAVAQELALHAAPDASPRLRALLQRQDLPSGIRVRCARELLAVSREDPVGLAALRDVLAGPADPLAPWDGDPVHRLALLAAARHLPEWPANLIHCAEPDDALLLELWKQTPMPKRRAFVETVAAAGPDYLDALIAGARHLVRTSRDQAAPLMKMLAPHLPDPTSGEIVVEAMVGSLRANRKDPRQAELAERILRRHDIWPKKPDSEDD
jgi:hypothetical protein